jgi:Tol biopolymer transport system component
MAGKDPYRVFYLRWAGADEMGRPTGTPELFTTSSSPFREEDARQLLPGVALGEPVVLPDGNALLSVEPKEGGGMQLVRRALSAEGGAPVTPIHAGGALERPTIDIDGEWVSFAEEVEGRWLVTVMRLDGSAPPRRVVEGRRPALRPDASSIAFVRSAGGRPRLFTVRLAEADPEGAVKRMFRGGEDADQDHPFWSPDNRWLAYLTNDEWAKHRGGSPERTWNIQAVGADGGEATIFWVTVGNAHVREAFWGPANKIFFRANTSLTEAEEALHYVLVEGDLAAKFWYRPNKR